MRGGSLGQRVSSMATQLPHGRAASVAACVIASEVLNGKTLDTNSHYLARRCFEHGLDLVEVRVVPDDVDVIVAAVHELSRTRQLVFTSGGIGPTHDDMTYEAIGRAFDRPLVPHAPTAALMREHLRVAELSEGQRRMACLPQPDAVHTTPGLWVPLVQVANTLLLPGVPRLFRAMLDHWLANELPRTALPTLPRMRVLLRTDLRESALAPRLAQIQRDADAAAQGVAIGSYPKMAHGAPSYVVLSLVGPRAASASIAQLAELLAAEFSATSYTEPDPLPSPSS